MAGSGWLLAPLGALLCLGGQLRWSLGAASPLSAVGGLLALGGGLLLLREARLTVPAVDPRLPAHSALPEDDPRRRLSRSTRRRLWLLSALGWVLVQALAVLLVMASRDQLGGWARLALFSGLAYGSLALVLALLRRFNGSTAWPGGPTG